MPKDCICDESKVDFGGERPPGNHDEFVKHFDQRTKWARIYFKTSTANMGQDWA